MGKKRKRKPVPLVSKKKVAKVRGWDWWKSIGAPRYVCAPMVDQSERAFRALCFKHSVGLCYTPMLLATVIARDKAYCKDYVIDDMAADTTDPEASHPAESAAPVERPIIAQLGGSEISSVVAAARWLETSNLPIDAIDLNLGCPQSCAKRGGYGSFTNLNQAVSLVRALHDNLSRLPVTVKIRILSAKGEKEEPDMPADTARTVAFARRLAEAGASVVAVHGRTRVQKGRGAADWDVIKACVSALATQAGRDGRGVPVIANGNVRCKADADALLEYTGAAAAMSAEALLANPHIFDPVQLQVPDSCTVALEYLKLATSTALAPPPPVEWARAHLVYLLKRALPLDKESAAALDQAKTLKELRAAVWLIDCALPRETPERICQAPNRRRVRVAQPGEGDGNDVDPIAVAAAAAAVQEARNRAAQGRQERHRLKIARTVASREDREGKMSKNQ